MAGAMESTGQPPEGDRPPLGHALDQLPVIVWTTDRELTFTSSEGGALVVLGLAPGQAVGRTLFEYFDTQDVTFRPIAEHVRALRRKLGPDLIRTVHGIGYSIEGPG